MADEVHVDGSPNGAPGPAVAPPPKGNLLALTLTRLVLFVSGLIVNVVAVRHLSREQAGVYMWVWTVVGLTTFLPNLGLWQLVTRQISREPERAPEFVATSLRMTWILSWLTTALITAYVWLMDGRPDVVLTAFLGGLTLAWTATSQMVQGALHGLRRMGLEVPAVLIGRVVFVFAQVIPLVLGFGVAWVYLGRVFSAWVMFVMLMVQFRRTVGPIPRRIPAGSLKALMGQGRTYGASVFFASVSAQADTVMMRTLVGLEEVARYGAPANVLLQLAFVANIVSRAFFPKVAQLNGQPDKVASELVLQSRILLLLSIPLAVGGVVVASPLVQFLFGARYADSALPFAILICTTPVRFLNNGYGFTLTALDRQGERARIDTAVALVNVAANLVAIPLYGAEGAAVTTLCTDTLAYFLLVRAVRQDVPSYTVLGPLVRTTVPALVMAAVVLALPQLHVLLRIGLGAGVYVAGAWLTRGWRVADLRRLSRV